MLLYWKDEITRVHSLARRCGEGKYRKRRLIDVSEGLREAKPKHHLALAFV